ncbi:MAG: pyridoxal 5'-phosphate synthase glutaminase subunit PdxT [Actinomycetota bacterium]
MLALQGAFRENAEAFRALGADIALVKQPHELASVDAIVLPGGESTTIDKLLDSSELRAPLTAALRNGMPAFATCAGLIVCATAVIGGRHDQEPLGVLDVTVRRNGYGRQRESFEAPLAVRDLGGGDFQGVFIRAPVVEAAGPAVEVLAVHDGVPVLGRQGRLWFSSFHPELAGDLRLHERFLHEVG